MKIKKKSNIGWNLTFVILIFLLLFPIFFALPTSFKSLNEAFNSNSLIPMDPTFSAYERVLSIIPFAKITLNTFIIASIVTVFKLATGILAAYSFIFLDFKVKTYYILF